MIKKIIVRLSKPKKTTYTSKKKALAGISKGQRVYKVKGGYRKTTVTTYKISKTGVRDNRNNYISKNKKFIEKLAKL